MKSHAVYPAALLAIVLILSALVGCSAPAVQEDAEPTPAPTQEAQVLEETPMTAKAPDSEAPDDDPGVSGKQTIGLIVPKDDSLLTKSAIHGFLRTAENLNYPARMYLASAGSSAAQLVDQAVEDGCAGLVVWVDSQELADAAGYAKEQGLPVVVTMAKGSAQTFAAEADSRLYADPSDYAEEAVRTMCETALSRGNKEGRIVIARQAGADQYIVDAFQAAVSALYPQYYLTDIPISDTRAETEAAAVAFLKEEGNRNIAGVFALAPNAATAWYNAEISAEKQFNFKINPAIMALDYTDENLALVGSSKILCLVARPYYTCAAQGTMVLDSILNGSDVQESIRVNAPIIRRKDVDKYAAIIDEVKAWFGS